MRRRIFVALAVCLLGTILGAWFLAGGGVLRPLTQKILESRADVVATLAAEVEVAEKPHQRLKRLSKRLKIDAKLRKKKPKKLQYQTMQKIETEGRWIMIMPGRESPMMTSIKTNNEQLFLVVIFPVNLETPRKKIAFGLLILAGCAVMGAWGLSRWSLRPLEQANQAMNKIAAGDLTHRVEEDIGETRETFNIMADKVEQLIQGQRQLIAAISHELRTPLTRLRLQTELLLEDGVPQKQLNRLNEDIDELDSLVEILLASAKLEQGSVALRITTVDVKSLIMEALSKVELGDRYVRLELPEEPMIQGDKQLLLRAVTNLLSNIQRYTPQDCTVSIQAKRDDKALHMTISDTGEGVSEEFLSRLFLPFEREEKSRSKATGGLGLGLMLVQKVVKAHNGTIEACINSPQGLSIAIVLPNAH